MDYFGCPIFQPKVMRNNRENFHGICSYFIRHLPRWLISLTKRIFILIASTTLLLLIRLVIISGGPPLFVDSDNPASFSSHFLTRFLTYSYLCALNFWLLLCPSRLCYDWSMGSIPLVESLNDPRNLATCGLTIMIGLLTYFGKTYTCVHM